MITPCFAQKATDISKWKYTYLTTVGNDSIVSKSNDFQAAVKNNLDVSAKAFI